METGGTPTWAHALDRHYPSSTCLETDGTAWDRQWMLGQGKGEAVRQALLETWTGRRWSVPGSLGGRTTFPNDEPCQTDRPGLPP